MYFINIRFSFYIQNPEYLVQSEESEKQKHFMMLDGKFCTWEWFLHESAEWCSISVVKFTFVHTCASFYRAFEIDNNKKCKAA